MSIYTRATISNKPTRAPQQTCLNPECDDRPDASLSSGYCRSCEEWMEEADPEFGIEYDA
jgi:hypothetical protein